MNIYKVTYKGLYLGGTAFVVAKDEEDAEYAVLNHHATVNPSNITAELINLDEIEGTVFGKVFYNDNGDY